jgi:hypothetical protein
LPIFFGILLLFVLAAEPAWANAEGEYDCRTGLQKLVDRTKERINDRSYAVRSQIAVQWHNLKKRFQKTSDSAPKRGFPSSSSKTIAHNKNTESSSDQGPRESVSSVDGMGTLYWSQTILDHLDPDTGVMKATRAPAVAIRNEGHVETTEVQLGTGTAAPKVGDFALIPSGFEPVGDRSSGMLKVNQQGNAVFQSRTGKAFDVAPRIPQALTKYEQKKYTATRHIPIKFWPSWMQTEILRLKKAALEPIAIATDLSRFISDRLLYSVDATDEMGVLAMAHSGMAQCDGAALMLATILRDHFGMATRVVTGFTGFQADGRSHVISPEMGHAWVEVFDPATQRWVLLDPTPHRKTRETKSPNSSDAFQPIANQDRSVEKPDDRGDETKDSAQRPQETSVKKMELNQNAEQAFVKATWENALGAYSDSKELANRLRLAAEVARKHRGSKPHREFAEKADRLLLDLATPSNHYSNLAQMAQGDQRRMAVLRDAMRLLSEVRPLTDPEIKLLQALNENTESITHSDPKSKKALIDSLTDQLGAIGQEAIAEKVQKEGALSTDTARKFALIGAVRSLIDLDFTTGQAPHRRASFREHKQRNPERPVALQTLSDLGNLANAFRDGQPHERDLDRFLSDELLELTNLDRRRATPKIEATPKKSIIVISDQSPSMEEVPLRAEVRDAAILAITDTTGLDNVLEVNFGGVVEKAIRIGPEPEQAKAAFQRRMNTTPSIPETNIGAAVNYGLKAAKGLDTTQLTIVLLTDGSGAWDSHQYEVEKARLEANGVRIDFKAVFFGGGNPELKKAVEATASQDGSVSHITFTNDRLEEIAGSIERQLRNPSPTFFRQTAETKENLASAIASVQSTQSVGTIVRQDSFSWSTIPLPKKPMALPDLPDLPLSERTSFAKSYFDHIALQFQGDFKSALGSTGSADRERLTKWLGGGR